MAGRGTELLGETGPMVTASNAEMTTYTRRAVCALITTPWLVRAQEPDPSTIRVTTNVVTAPTVVIDAGGRLVTGLLPQDFVVLDNDKPQEFKVDVTFQPIDLVVVIQADAVTEEVLPRIKKVAPLFDSLVTGDQGQVAIVAFDHRIRTMQDFTSDSAKIKKALESINPGSSSARQIDAINEATRMLSRRSKDRRRIIMLVSETRDKGSEGRLRDTLTLAEVNNVMVYTVNMNRLVNTLMAKTPVPRPSAIPPEARHMPNGQTATPNDVMQNSGWGANAMPAFVEIFRQAKAVFVSNPAEVFTKFTGGREFGFVSQRALEEAIGAIGEELHSQYLISYTPSNMLEGGWHTIQIQVRRPNLTIRTRPGYWLAAVPR